MTLQIVDEHGQRGVPMAVAVPILFGLVSIIGAMATWNLAIVSERQSLVRLVREEVGSEAKSHEQADELKFAGFEKAIAAIEARLAVIEANDAALQRQVLVNSGIIDNIRETHRPTR